MTIVQVLGVSFKGAGLSAPKLSKIDPMESDGSLLLIDFSNPLCWADTSTLPADGTLITNPFWSKAASIIGSGNSSSLSSVFDLNQLTGTSSSKHKYEFSSLKGLHGIVSQSPGLASDDHIKILAPDLIKTYVLNNLPDTGAGHDFYLSIWYKTTRAALNSTSAMSAYADTTSNYAYYFKDYSPDNLADIGDSAATSSDKRVVVPNTAGSNAYRSLHMSGFHGDKSNMGLKSLVLNWWGSQGAWKSFATTTAQSYVVYKIYLEDLTVSGRTYAQVDALDYSLWQKAFASGGRFYNDTYTNPTTLP